MGATRHRSPRSTSCCGRSVLAEDPAPSVASLQRIVDLGHHLVRYYVSGDSALDDRFLTEMKDRFGDRIRLKSIDMSLSFTAWDTALRYAEVHRHHNPIHFEHPSRSILSLPCDPMGPVLYMESPAKERIRAEGSHLYPFEGPGWGVELDEEKMKQLTTAAA